MSVYILAVKVGCRSIEKNRRRGIVEIEERDREMFLTMMRAPPS
jgi:hypothetical protein